MHFHDAVHRHDEAERLSRSTNSHKGKVMDKFMEDFSRRFGEDVQDYNNRFDREVAEAEKISGDFYGGTPHRSLAKTRGAP